MNQATNHETTNQLMAFWHTLRHYRGWISLGTVMLSLVGCTFVLLLPDHYKATTTILVDPQKVSEKYVSPTVNSDPGQRLTTITQQVLSTTRLQQIIDDMHLYPELRGKISREELIDLMRKDITITVKQGSSSGLSAFTIEYEGHQREQVAQVANQLAASFIEWNVKNREQQAQDTTEFLDAQLKEAKQNLEQQEARLSAFKMRHLGEMPEQQAANMQALTQLQTQFQANADALNRLEVERTLLSRGLESPNPGEVKTVPVLTERAKLESERRRLRSQLQELQNRYTSAHPEVIDMASQLKRVEDRLKTLPPDPPIVAEAQDNTAVSVRLQIIDRESKRLTQEQERLTGQMGSYRAKVDAVPVREQEMAELNRNYSVSKDHYQSLLDKTFSASMAADLEKKQQAEHFTILDLAQVP
jgi:succinoglycan biosynthesis transport protein ExoP